MIGYCIPCAKKVGAQPVIGAFATTGTCAICTLPTMVLNENNYDTGRHRLNGAALKAKLQRGRATERSGS